TVTLTEGCPAQEEPWSQLPAAVVPGPPINTKGLRAAIEEVAARLSENGPDGSAIADILWRQPALDTLTTVEESLPEASYLAVEGPPGTGKAHLAASVIKHLVEQHQWRVGVVAQSHKVVENVLRKLVSDD